MSKKSTPSAAPLGEAPPRLTLRAAEPVSLLAHTQQQALGENWKSALCVTSLYDSYVAVQHENEQLRARVTELERAHSVCCANGQVHRPDTQPSRGQLEDAAALDACHREIRLLRTEKSQQALLFEKSCAQLMHDLESTRKQLHEQLTKYQHKFSMDPCAPQRVALSTQKLQDALDRVVQEKTELGIQHQHLLQRWQEQQDQHDRQLTQLTTARNDLQRQCEGQALQRLVLVMQRWTRNRVSRAWRQWQVVSVATRCHERTRALEQQREQKAKATRDHVRQQRANKLMLQLLVRSSRRLFSRWKRYCQARAERTRTMRVFTNTRKRAVMARGFTIWSRFAQVAGAWRSGHALLLALMRSRAMKRAWRTWVVVAVRIELTLVKQEHHRLVDGEYSMQKTRVHELELLLASAHERLELVSRQCQQRQEEITQLTSCHRKRTAFVRKRWSDYLVRRNETDVLCAGVQVWRRAVRTQLVLKAKIKDLHSRRQFKQVCRTVAHWQLCMSQKRRQGELMRRALQRMRILCAYRCFAAWRDTVAAKQTRRESLQAVIHRMMHHSLINSFACWSEYLARRRTLRGQLSRMITLLEKLTTSKYFRPWKEITEATIATRELEKQEAVEQGWRRRMEESKHQLIVLRACLDAWRTMTARTKRCQKLALKYAIRWRRGTCGACFDAWKEKMAQRQWVREALRRVASRWVLNSLQKGWARWKIAAVVIYRETSVLNVQRDRDIRIQQLEQELTQARESEATACMTLRQWEIETENRLCHIKMQLEDTQTKKRQFVAALIVYYAKQRAQRFLKQCLRMWVMVVSNTRCNNTLVSNFQAMITHRQMRQSFGAWKVRRRRQVLLNAVAKMLQYAGHTQWKQACWTAWCSLIVKKRGVTQLQIRVNAAQKRRLCQLVFHSWRRHAHETALLTRILTGTWWKQAIEGHVKRSFTQWRTYTNEDKRKEEEMTKKTLLASIHARICWQWSAFSLKMVLCAWKCVVQRRRRIRQGAHRVALVWHRHTTSTTFQMWKLRWELVGVRRLQLGDCIARHERRGLFRSFAQWRKSTILDRQNELSHLREARATLEAQLSNASQLANEAATINHCLHNQIKLSKDKNEKVKATMRRLDRNVSVSRWFYVWRTYTYQLKATMHRLRLMLENKNRRAVQTALAAWRTYSRRSMLWGQCLIQVNAAKQLYERRAAAFVRGCLQSWRAYANRCGHIKKQVHRLVTRRRQRKLTICLNWWQMFILRGDAARTMLGYLEISVKRTQLRDAFMSWKKEMTEQKTRMFHASEKQKRLMAFLVNKEAYQTTRCFEAWQSLATARVKRRQHAQRLFLANLAQTKQVAWGRWHGFIMRRQDIGKCLTRITRLYTRQGYRCGLARWKKHVFLRQIKQLTLEASRAVEAMNGMCGKLDVERSNSERLQGEIVVCKATLIDTRKELDQATEVAAIGNARLRLEYTQRTALAKVILNAYFIPQPNVVASAWVRWCQFCHLDARRTRLLKKCGHEYRRRQQIAAFRVWKRLATFQSRRDEHRRQFEHGCLQSAWYEWTRWRSDRRKARRRFIMRWIDRFYAKQDNTILKRKLAMAFKIWQQNSLLARIQEDMQQAEQERTVEKAEHRMQRQRLLLAKWCWRAYHARCESLRLFFYRGTIMSMGKTIQTQHSQFDELIARNKSLQLATDEIAALQSRRRNWPPTRDASEPEGFYIDKHTLLRVFQGLQTVFRRIAAAITAEELFSGINSVFGQIIPGSGATLLLLDPVANELWTKNDDTSRIDRVPATLGIAGHTICSLSTSLIDDVTADPRFHPLVDQLVVSRVSATASSAPIRQPTFSSTVALFSTAVVAADGSVYGVLQIAFPSCDDQYMSDTMALHATLVQLVGRAACILVEQVLYGMVRHCQDRLQARSPDAFTKLFKQNKNWRKYFVQVERHAEKTQGQLEQLAAEQDALLHERERLQEAMRSLQQQQQVQCEKQREEERRRRRRDREKERDTVLGARVNDRDREHVVGLLTLAKQKVSQLKQLVLAKEQIIHEKTRELDNMGSEYARYRSEVQMREWRTTMEVSTPPRHRQHHHRARKGTTGSSDQSNESDADQEDGIHDGGTHRRSHVIRSAQLATLRNQLVRTEADAHVLVKAVEAAIKRQGIVPDALKMEVNRIALRLKQTRE